MKITPYRRPRLLTLVDWAVHGLALLFRLCIWCGLIAIVLLTLLFFAKILWLFLPLFRNAIGEI